VLCFVKAAAKKCKDRRRDFEMMQSERVGRRPSVARCYWLSVGVPPNSYVRSSSSEWVRASEWIPKMRWGPSRKERARAVGVHRTYRAPSRDQSHWPLIQDFQPQGECLVFSHLVCGLWASVA
jgi:hypothetical protein